MTRPRRPVLRALLSAAAAPLAAITLFSAGCESADEASLSVSATKRDLTAVGETTVLKTSGWNHYAWSLSDPSIGVLSAKTGESVVYTATKMPNAGGSHLNQVVTCQTTDPGDGNGVHGTITIRHLSQGGTASSSAATHTATGGGGSGGGGSGGGGNSGGGDSGGGSTSRLTLSQSSVTVELSASTITAVPISVVSPVTGRTYRWSISPSLGRLNTTTGTAVSYTPPSSISYRGRTVTVTCTDSVTHETASCVVSLQ